MPRLTTLCRLGAVLATAAGLAAQDRESETPATPPGMVLVPGGVFAMGCADADAPRDERPVHEVRVSAFFIDATEVTNRAFAAFVEATGYVTTAERPVEIHGTTIPAGSLVFAPPALDSGVGGGDPTLCWSDWWRFEPGACWRHPTGPGSDLAGRDDHPVVQVSWDDACAFAAWAGKRLPTEAEWECAARGGLAGARFGWGDEPPERGAARTNVWQGPFPQRDDGADGFRGTAPVGSFPPNGFGVSDMAGNVWEWCLDVYAADAYAKHSAGTPVVDPLHEAPRGDPRALVERVTRGGSYLCSDSYCRGYRPSARMKASADTGLVHTGFRCVVTPAMLAAAKAAREPPPAPQRGAR